MAPPGADTTAATHDEGPAYSGVHAARPGRRRGGAAPLFLGGTTRGILKAYPEQIVAVRDGEVVAAHADLAALVGALSKRGLDPRTDVAIEFITSHSGNLLL